MGAIELPAMRKYRRLESGSGSNVRQVPLAELLSAWIERDACPQIATFMQRNEFRALAKAPITSLQAGSGASERQVVDDASATLVRWAKALEKFLHEPANLTSLACVGKYNVWQPMAGGSGVAATDEGFARAEGDRQAVQHIASRPWRYLVCTNDYFELAAGLYLKEDSSSLDGGLHDRQLWQFSGFGNPDLLVPGNRIVQGLLLRIEHWSEALRPVHLRCRTAADNCPPVNKVHLEQANVAAAEFQGIVDHLRRILVGRTMAHLIEDAVVLVQAYADYFPDAELGWLPVSAAYRRRQGYAYWLIRRENFAISDRIAGALERIGNALDGNLDVDEWVELLRTEASLLIVSGQGRRECYWRGVKLNVPWNRNEVLWLLIVELVRAAKQGRGTSSGDIDPESTRRLKSPRFRLKDLLPKELDMSIKVGSKGCYELCLPPRDMSLIEIETEDRLILS